MSYSSASSSLHARGGGASFVRTDPLDAADDEKDESSKAAAAALRGARAAASSSSVLSPSASASAASSFLPVPRADLALGAAFLALALGSRLWRIENPRGVVFDESHFNKFSTWYVSGHYFVDIHPPLAKLVFAAVLWAFGFRGAGELNVKWWTAEGFVGTRDWELLYDEQYRTASGLLPYLPLRVTAALVGSALVVVMFASARALGLGRAPAALAATLVLCETVTALQSRLILCDAFLYFFNVASFGASFASVRASLSPAHSLRWALAVGLLLGCALSVKLTAIGTVGTVGVHQAIVLGIAWWRAGAGGGAGAAARRRGVLAWGAARAGLMLAAVCAVFFSLWTIHIRLLPYSGQGDGFSSPSFAATLYEKPPPDDGTPRDPFACPNPGNSWSDCGFSPMTEAQCLERGCCWDPSSNKAWCYHKGPLTRPTLSWAASIYDVLRATDAINHGGVLLEHPSMSEWREWPLLGGRSVPFSSSAEGGPITALGNPGVHWPVAAAVAVASLGLALWAATGAARALGLLGGGAAGPAAGAVSAAAEGDAWPEDGGGARATPPWAAVLALTAGYYANLVPYELIERSKFIYHYNPALLIGVLLLAALVDAAWAAAAALRTPAGRQGGARAVGALAAAVAAVAVAGFAYWGIPYVYGIKLSPEAALARKWRSAWVT